MNASTNYILTIFLLAIVSISNAQTPEPRNMIWLRGHTALSNTLSDAENAMKNFEYEFKSVNKAGSYKPWTGVLNTTTLLADDINSKPYDDILIVSHGYGGVVSRHLQHQSGKVNAMITIGAPHNGSELVHRFSETGPFSKSEIEKLIDNIKEANESDNCEVCHIYDRYSDWISEINNSIESLEDIAKNSAIVDNMNNQSDVVPILNIVGNDQPLNRNGLTSVIDSRTIIGSSANELMLTCLTRERAAARKALDEAKNSFILSSIFGAFSRVVGLVTSLAKADTSAVGIIDAVGGFISGVGNDLVNSITEFNEINKEAARFVRCDYANSLLSIGWNEILTNSYQGDLIEGTIELPSKRYNQCIDDCEFRLEFDFLDCNCTCEEYCEHLADETRTVPYKRYEFNGHDWIYTVGEQELESDMQVGESIEIRANHFEEVTVDLITPHLQDIFDGAYGAAFEVPKIN